MCAWKTITSKSVYQNPWIHISERKVLSPNNTEALYGKVHFKNIAIGILALDEDNNIHLVGQDRYTINDYSWEIPEGGALLGENYLDAAKRELKEETGVTALKWEEYLRLHTSNSVTDEWAIIYKATMLEYDTAEPEHTEKFEYMKKTPEEVHELINHHRITDAMSVAVLNKYLLDLK